MTPYTKPTITTLEAREILESLGPAQGLGSGAELELPIDNGISASGGRAGGNGRFSR